MIIRSYEDGARAEACADYLIDSECASKIEKLILLPIPSTKDKQTILKTNIYINEVFDDICDGTVVSCYGLGDDFITKAELLGASVIDLSIDEEFLRDNAELTALCALGIFLGTTTLSPREISIGIVGYGRIGKKLTDLFLYLGARVRVFTSRPGTMLDLCEYGVASSESTRSADLSGLDILVNTAPAVIFPPENIPEGLRIMELASGDNFPGVNGVEKYPSIPARMFPRSAGKAWGRAIERHVLRGDKRSLGS